jgi:anti-sigma-K factor RskA
MNCDELEQLLAAYAIGALSTDEAGRVSAHLASCRRHDEALADLRVTVDSLAIAPPEREPSPALRARVLAAIAAEPSATQPVVVPMRPRRWFAPPQPTFAWAAAAVLLLAVVGLGAWNAVLQLGGDEDGGPVTATLEGSAGRAELVYLADRDLAVFDVDLSDPPPGREYQAWGIHETGPVSLGLLPNSGTIALRGDLTGATAVAVTIEPKGGSDQPTTDPVMAANLK